MSQVDPEHRRARADERVERDDGQVGVLAGEPVDEVDLRADGDRGAGGRGRDGPDDVVRRADLIGHLDDLVGALGMHDDDAVRMLGTERFDVRRREPLVHRAVALPEQERGFLHLAVLAGRPRRWRGFHDAHVGRRRSRAGSRCCGRDAGRGRRAPSRRGALHRRLATALRRPAAPSDRPERPGQHGAGVRGGADGAAVAPDEGLQRGGGVHVGDRDDGVDVGDLGELLPAPVDARRGRPCRPSSSRR